MAYFDNAAAAIPDMNAIATMNDYMRVYFYNPSGHYSKGRETRGEIDKARKDVAYCINAATPQDIIFTSGSTESNNIALQSFAKEGFKLFTTSIEHHAVLNVIPMFKDYALINLKDGVIDVTQLEERLKNSPAPPIVSIMAVNNETGYVSPLKEIGALCKKYDAFFFCDATQALGKIPIDVQKMHIDMLSGSAHKFGGVRGAGFLYANEEARQILKPLVYGGGHENGFRSGTESAPLICAMSVALVAATKNINKNYKKMLEVMNYFKDSLLNLADNIHFNNEAQDASRSGIISVRFDGIKSEELLEFIGNMNVSASAGSACNSDSGKPSYVLTAIGLTEEEANSTLRFSFNYQNTKEEVDYCINIIKMYYQMYAIKLKQ